MALLPLTGTSPVPRGRGTEETHDGPARLEGAGGAVGCQAVRRAGSAPGHSGMTLRATVADTSSCSLTVTSWAPSALIGLPTAIVRLSTSWPAALLSASASAVTV